MIVDVYNEVFTKLTNDITDASVYTDYSDKKPSFPCITLGEGGNLMDMETLDSSGEHVNIQSFDINIYDDSKQKRSVVKALASQVDSIMADEYGMQREFAQQIPNALDKSIYRYNLRYDFKIDENKTVYRG